MRDLIERLAAVEAGQGEALDKACAPRVHRRQAVPFVEEWTERDSCGYPVRTRRTGTRPETDEELRERWYRSFDVRTVDVMVENLRLHEQVHTLQARSTEQLEECRALRRQHMAPEQATARERARCLALVRAWRTTPTAPPVLQQVLDELAHEVQAGNHAEGKRDLAPPAEPPLHEYPHAPGGPPPKQGAAWSFWPAGDGKHAPVAMAPSSAEAIKRLPSPEQGVEILGERVYLPLADAVIDRMRARLALFGRLVTTATLARLLAPVRELLAAHTNGQASRGERAMGALHAVVGEMDRAAVEGK